jgi:hypothetical protein
MPGKNRCPAINHQTIYNTFASRKRHTKSCNAFMIHSPPLREGTSRITPTSASSVQTRTTGRCWATRAVSSFSYWPGAMVASAALFDGTSTLASVEMRAVSMKAEMTCGAHICMSKMGSCLCVIQATHLHSALHIPFRYRSCDLFDILL